MTQQRGSFKNGFQGVGHLIFEKLFQQVIIYDIKHRVSEKTHILNFKNIREKLHRVAPLK